MYKINKKHFTSIINTIFDKAVKLLYNIYKGETI